MRLIGPMLLVEEAGCRIESGHADPRDVGRARRGRARPQISVSKLSSGPAAPRWFGLITSQAIRRGTFDSVRQLERTINAYLATWNDDPKPFVWTKTPAQSLTVWAQARSPT